MNKQGAFGNPVVALGILGLFALLANFPAVFLDKVWVTADLYSRYHISEQFFNALREGTLYPRWAPLHNSGLGEPWYLYIHPLYYYCVALANAVVGDIWSAFKVVLVAGSFATGVIAWRFLRGATGPGTALLGGCLVQALPAYFFVFYFYNGPEWHLAFPFLLSAMIRTVLDDRKPVSVALAVSVAGLALSHILVAFTALVCIPFGLLVAARGGARQLFGRLAAWSVSVLLGLGLAGAYLVPALTSQGLISTHLHASLPIDYHNSFAFPVFTWLKYGMYWFSFQWLVPVAALAMLVPAAAIAWRTRHLTETALAIPLAFFSLVSIAAFVLASELAFPLYSTVKYFQQVERPLRFLSVAASAAVIAACLAVAALREADSAPRLKLILYSAMAPSLLLTTFLCSQIVVSGTHLASMHWPLPRFGVASMLPATAGPAWKEYLKRGGMAEDCGRRSVTCDRITSEAHRHAWRIETGGQVDLLLPLFHFPAWETTLDGAAQPARFDTNTGLVEVAVPPGRHVIEVRWKAMPQERYGAAVSAFSVLLLPLAWFWQRRA